MKTKFETLVKLGEKHNIVVEREKRGYSAYSNTTFTGINVRNLVELQEFIMDDISQQTENGLV